MRSIRFLVAALAALPTFAWPGAEIAPYRINVDAGGRGVVTLTQSADKRASYQITPYTWSVENNQDVLAETTEFIASPPAVDLEPGASRIIRVGFRNPTRAATERTFRLVITELPDGQPAMAGAGASVMKIATALSIPVFIAPAKVDATALDWSLRRDGDTLFLRAQNGGNRHVQVHTISLTSATGEVIPLDLQQKRYVLPGIAREWPFPAPSTSPAKWHLEATTSREPLTADLELQ